MEEEKNHLIAILQAMEAVFHPIWQNKWFCRK